MDVVDGSHHCSRPRPSPIACRDVGNYKPVLKRIQAAPKRCDELVKMMHERAKIEKSYAKELAAFADKWEDKVRNPLPRPPAFPCQIPQPCFPLCSRSTAPALSRPPLFFITPFL